VILIEAVNRSFTAFALKSSPKGEDIDGGAFDFCFKSNPHLDISPDEK
jgi:hypothetical protein